MSQHFIPWAKPSLIGNEKRYVLDALESTWISGGPYVDRLEKQIAEKMNVSEVLAVSSGTAALELSLRSLNINTDDEVILPGFTGATFSPFSVLYPVSSLDVTNSVGLKDTSSMKWPPRLSSHPLTNIRFLIVEQYV